MRGRDLIAEAKTPDGDPLALSAEGGEFVVRVRGETLMSSRQSGPARDRPGSSGVYCGLDDR